MYAKAHPFGYKPAKRKVEGRGFREYLSRLQTIYMKDGSVRTIEHYDKTKKGRTLGDMVYESVRV